MTLIFEDVIRPEVLRREKLTRRIIIGIFVALLVGGLAYYQFKNYPEERAVKTFLAALERGDLQAAYRLWQPSPSYRFQDFARDWGPKGEHGQVRAFKITTSHARSNIVVVTAAVNGQETSIWVQRSNKSLSFPPF